MTSAPETIIFTEKILSHRKLEWLSEMHTVNQSMSKQMLEFTARILFLPLSITARVIAICSSNFLQEILGDWG